PLICLLTRDHWPQARSASVAGRVTWRRTRNRTTVRAKSTLGPGRGVGPQRRHRSSQASIDEDGVTMEWKWVWLALLLVVIAAAVWLLLRRPGGSEGVSGQDTSTLPAGTDADAIPPSQAGGYAPGVANDPGAP